MFTVPGFSLFSLSTGVQDRINTMPQYQDQDRQSGRVLTLRALIPRHTSLRYQAAKHTLTYIIPASVHGYLQNFVFRTLRLQAFTTSQI